jgi:hypothetical protein
MSAFRLQGRRRRPGSTRLRYRLTVSYGLVFQLPERMSAHDEPDALTAPDLAVWSRIADRARSVLGNAEVTLAARWGEVYEQTTGIQLQVSAEHASITVPYWHFDDAAGVIGKAYQLAEIVEDETSLTGFDPQLDMSVREGRQVLDLAIEFYTGPAAMIARAERTQARADARRAQRERE